MWVCVCVFVGVRACVCILFPRRCVGKSNVRVTGCVSSRHSSPIRKPLVFLSDGVLQGFVGDESDQTCYFSPDRPIGKFVCSCQVSTSRGQLLCTFMTCKIQLICAKMSKFRSESIINTTKYLFASVFRLKKCFRGLVTL